MKKIFIKNKLYIYVAIITFIIMLITALNDTGLFYNVFKFITDKNFRTNFTLAESNIRYDISLFGVITKILTDYEWTYDVMNIWALNIFQILLPIFSALACLYYYQKRNTIYKFAIYKSDNYFKSLIKYITSDSLKMSTSAFIGYLIFLLLSLLISNGNINYTISRTFLLDILGSNFYTEYPVIYYLLSGFIKLFLVNFIYIMFSLSIVELFAIKNNKLAFLNPLIWYYTMVLIASILSNNINENFVYLSPALIMISDSYNNIDTLKIFLLPIMFFLLSVNCLRKAGKKNEL